MVKNILAVRNDRFGEFLLNIPAFRAIREYYPDAGLTLMVDPYVEELAQCIPFVNRVIAWSHKRHGLSETLRFAAKIKREKFDLSIAFNPSQETNIITFMAGIPIRAGYNRKWGFLLTRSMEDKKHLGNMHEVEYNLALAGLTGAKTQNKSLSLSVDDRAVNDIPGYADIGDSSELLVIHPWTSDPVKQWPLENFSELAARLLKEKGIRVAIVGGRDELQQSGFFFRTGRGLINLTGRTTLMQLAALLKRCKLLISGDSGPVHLACAVGTPVIALFRNDIPGKGPKRWGPWGKGNLVIEKPSLFDITVGEVLNKASEVL